ncbi:MAG: hypothetical protein H6709_05895 [Kofleriaceae bacterium]|nr:hypothetical protein [Myxococcales bacterium]MCB9560464.1 hypothetical protein [Kofleriaceae bacterium]MCB9571605.1 hypothetical protein [Kofleriaceae bacterium]
MPSASTALPTTLADLATALPPRIWYLTSNGQDMWCRRPYGFFFSTGEAAEGFAGTFGSEYGLSAIGVETRELLTDAALDALRGMHVTRIFVDPQIDPATGDVFGQILRLADQA